MASNEGPAELGMREELDSVISQSSSHTNAQISQHCPAFVICGKRKAGSVSHEAGGNKT